jgi:hypothetical protein
MMLRGKTYDPGFDEPWTLREPDETNPWYALCDRSGRELLRTPGHGPSDVRIARRVLHAVNGTVNFTAEQLERLAGMWNENARRQKGRESAEQT